MLLAMWLVNKSNLEQCKAEQCDFRVMVMNEVSWMIGIDADDIITGSVEDDDDDDVCDKFFV